MVKKVTPKVESELLLNIKDIEKAKTSNLETKKEAKALKLEESLEKYNQSYLKALNAPIPKISLHFNEVLTRAVPIEVKSKSGLILSVPGNSDFKIAEQLSRLSHAVQEKQEILMVGGMISEGEQEKGIRPGRMCKINFKNFRSMSDRHLPGHIEMEYEIPAEQIGEYQYLIIDKRDIIYTYDPE